MFFTRRAFFSLFLAILFSTLPFLPFESRAQSETPEIKKTSLDLPKNMGEFELIKISLLNKMPEALIETSSPFKVTDRDGRPLFQGDRIVSTAIRPSPGGIKIGSLSFSQTPLTIQSEGGSIKVDQYAYRHALKIWRDSGKALSVVNEIDLEDYLKGVLPWEANPEWSVEVLKAQAVASRTFALFKAIENQKKRYAVSKGVLSQVYGGKNLEDPKTDKAIEATRGEILTYDGKIFPAYFHSTCGGKTTQAEYLWDVEAHPALKGVTCDFCRSSKHYKWEAELTKAEIEKKLKKHRINVPGIRGLAATQKDASGRAKKFEIEYAGGKKKIHSNDFRIWMDPAKLRSTLIYAIYDEGDHFRLKGRGWGHGVGMCQFGAKQLSDLGYSYREILEYYYPGSAIRQLKDSDVPIPDVPPDLKKEEDTERKSGWKAWLQDLFDL